MRSQAGCKIFTALIGCLMGLSRGMIYEPFETCLESAQVDSIQEWTWVDSNMETAPPYRSLFTVSYQPGTCIPAKDFFKGYWTDKPNIGTYTLRPGARTVDYAGVFGDGSGLTGATYYSAAGKMDSTEYTETVTDITGKYVARTTRYRYFAKPGYELAQSRVREGTGPWTLVQQDSVVPKGAGKIIYSKGEVNAVTTCIAEGNTFACTPVGSTGSPGELRKQVWYLTGERVDSLLHYNPDGVRIQTDKWFWSGKSGTRIAGKTRVPSPERAALRAAFDAAGRKFPEPDRARRRFLFLIAGDRKN